VRAVRRSCKICKRTAVAHDETAPCPLWVISGHVGLHEKESALLLKADILRGGYNTQLSAISRLLHHLMVDQLECIW
jgi:hypothetical protein